MGGEEKKGGDCVKVAIRCRPPSQKELNNNESNIVDMVEAFGGDGDPGKVILNDPAGHEKPAEFAFDIVFGLAIHQVQVYEAVGRPALSKTFEGYNGTIFAYGQTGSGKSFSMSGAPTPDLRGIIPRINEELFRRVAEEQAGTTRKFLVMCSYFEIYNEIIFDLLNPESDRSKLGGGLQIKEHPVMGIYVKDLTEIVAENAKKLEDMLEQGQKNRAVSSTMMNATSSRSHSIFTIKVHQKDEEDTSRNVFAKLNLVDLAGSERQKGTGATGQTLKEGANINKSLSALGNVINALVETANGKKVFIPYRNSKLTRVLQESLGGNSLCTMLAALSPAACNFEETMSTLRYANRAKEIKVSATKNEEASQISRLKAEVEELKKKLAGASGGGDGGLSAAEREAEKAKFEKQLTEMQSMMSNNWGEKEQLSKEQEKKLQRIAEAQARAAKAVEEERSRRLRLLQEKNDLELTLRGFIDFLLSLPKQSAASRPVLTGEEPRKWLKTYRSLRHDLEQLKEQCTMVKVFKQAFDDDVKLWGEGVEADDVKLAMTGLSRCLPKLDKLRKGGEKLLKLESQGRGSASDLAEAVRQATVELERSRKEAPHDADRDNSDEASHAQNSALEEVSRMLQLIQKQVKEKIDEVSQHASIDVAPTCELVLQYSRGSDSDVEEAKKAYEVLKTLIATPHLASLPPGMPAKALREYGPDDVQDTPETTEAVLGQLIRWEELCGKTKKSASELLSRPPPKFIFDVTVAVQAATGFPENVDGEWPEVREDRLTRLQAMADAVSSVLGVTIGFDPADVLKGKEVAKTLRLMQLLGVAAAKKQPPDRAAQAAAQSPNGTGAGIARARALPALLNAADHCLRAAKQQVETRLGSTAMGAAGERGLEERIEIAERQLQEAVRNRRLEEETVATVERQLQATQAEAKQMELETAHELESSNAAAEQGQDPELLELERQVNDLVNQTGNAGELPEEAVQTMLCAQLNEVRDQLHRDESDVSALEEKHQGLQREVAEAEESARKLQQELLRERARLETEQELMGQSPEEQKVILEAHEQKLRERVDTLEAQIAGMQPESEERKASILALEQDERDLAAKAEETHLQIQIVEEERDAMREAMEQLWKEKSWVDEELQDREQSYINLSESFNLRQDEACDLQESAEKLRMEIAEFQKNSFHTAAVVA